MQPWGQDPPTLHWFNLTDGWYWIEIDKHQLLRYSDQTMRHSRADGYDGLPYVDYYVVRLWEDLLRMLSDVLEPVPDDLRWFIEADPAGWAERADDDDDFSAEVWHDGHTLDLGYLRNPPRIRWWRTVDRDADLVTVEWRERRAVPDADIVFAGPGAGRLAIPTEAFIEAIRELDRDLMLAMRQRIVGLESQGIPPGVDLDLARLRTEHDDRATWLVAALDRPVMTDWDAVRTGATVLRGEAP